MLNLQCKNNNITLVNKQIQMSQLQNWSHVVRDVENANLEQQTVQNWLKVVNKRAYKQELDREVQLKNYDLQIKNSLKRQELFQAKILADQQKKAKFQSKLAKQKLQKHYGEQNQSLIKLQNMIKFNSKSQQRRNIQKYLQHPFVKLIDQQDNRIQNLRDKLIKQNQINHLQEKMHLEQNKIKRLKQLQQKTQFMNYIEQNHEKRSADRQKFKNKYLRIQKSQLDSSLPQNFKTEQSVQKMYVNYLNNQIKKNNQKKNNQKKQLFNDQRISNFYSNHQIQPDSSPAFIGRNPLTHQRKRQLYFINKHLNTRHERPLFSNSQLNHRTQAISLHQFADKNQVKSVKFTTNLNPETQAGVQNFKYNQFQTKNPRQSNIFLFSHLKPLAGQRHIQTENSMDEKNLKHPQIQQIYKNRNESNIFSNGNRLAFEKQRIKSQFREQNFRSPQKLPYISKKLLQPQEHQLDSNSHSTGKKQYSRYDVITGKKFLFYI